MEQNELEKWISLREEGRANQDQKLLAEVRQGLKALLEKQPDEAAVHYQCGIAHDNSGLGREAIPYYEKALELGLSGPDRERCLLGLGSTYRYWGRYSEAVHVLRQGVAEFPGNRALKAYLSMALYNTREYKESVELLIANLMESTDDGILQYFKRGILAYAEDLDETAAEDLDETAAEDSHK